MSQPQLPYRGLLRFEVPAELPDEPVDRYQARLRQAQQAYRVGRDSAWDDDAIRQPSGSAASAPPAAQGEPTGDPADDSPWQPPAVVKPARRLGRLGRSAGRGRAGSADGGA